MTGTDLTALRLPELQALAAERGISGASKLRKGELMEKLSESHNDTPAADAATQAPAAEATGVQLASTDAGGPAAESAAAADVAAGGDAPRKRTSRRATAQDGVVTTTEAVSTAVAEKAPEPTAAAPASDTAAATDAAP
ncbi:MAG TPA: Rho termination factor N-terminal domain-containing protein, partial [Terrimesophilobacter sp.]|nr:Rho termination factor N-terminal domain-containing protein [Terrimesophilobacter sp.]